MKLTRQFIYRFHGLASRLVAKCARKLFRPRLFVKYEVAPRRDAPAAERRIRQKLSSSNEQSPANH
jgi:hypothetical protein